MPSLRRPKLVPALALGLGLFALAGAEDLARAADTDADEYVKLLKTSDDPATKVIALEKLGKLGQLMKSAVTPAVPDMLKALEDKDPKVRAAAARAVGKIDLEPEKAIPALLKLTKEGQPEPVRMAAIQGLAAMGPNAKDAMSDLRKIIKTEDEKSKLSRAAKDAMKSINPKN